MDQIDQIDSVTLSMSRNDAAVVKQQTNGILRNKKTQDKSSNDILEGSNSDIKSKRPKSKSSVFLIIRLFKNNKS